MTSSFLPSSLLTIDHRPQQTLYHTANMPPPLQGLQRTYFLTPNANYHQPTGMYGIDTLKFHPKALMTTTFQPSSFNQHDSTSPEAIRSRAIYNTCLAFSTQHYGPSPSWQKAVEHGNFNIGYDTTLDAHLQHRLSYEPFSWDPLSVPEVYEHQNEILLRLEWSYRSSGRDRGEVGLCLNRCGGTKLSHVEYEFEEYVPPMSLLEWANAPTSFDLLKLPIEIIGCVVEQCTPGDGAALSLTWQAHPSPSLSLTESLTTPQAKHCTTLPALSF